MPKTIEKQSEKADVFTRVKDISNDILEAYCKADVRGDEFLEDFCCLPHEYDIWPEKGNDFLTVCFDFNDTNSEYLFSVPPNEMTITVIGYCGINSDMLASSSTNDFLNQESIEKCVSQTLLNARDRALEIPEKEAKQLGFYEHRDYSEIFDFSGVEACIQGETKQIAKERGQQVDDSIHIAEKSETSQEPEKN